MTYEETPVKNGNAKDIKKQATRRQLDQAGSWTIIWTLIKRHKFGLVLTWAIAVTILYLFPFAPDLLLTFFKG